VRPATLYLPLALVSGLALVVVTPPLQSPDESHHLFRAYQLAEGDPVPDLRTARDPTDAALAHHTGGRLPAGLWAPNLAFYTGRPVSSLALLREAFALRLDPGDRMFLGFSNTAMSPPLIYVPQAVGVLAANAVTDSVLAFYYAGRVVNLLAGVALVGLALRLAPFGGWTLACLALMPMTMALFASQSSDVVTIGVCFLWCALVLRLASTSAQPVSLVAALLATALALAWTKQVYLALGALVLLVPPARVGGARRWLALTAALALVVVAAGGAWGLVTQAILTPSDPTSDPEAMARFLREHPGEIALRMLRTPFLNGRVDGEEFLGVLGLLDLHLPAWLLLGHALCLVAVAACEGGGRLDARQRGALALVALAGVASVWLGATVIWGRPEDRFVDYQGRYLIPLAPVALWVLHGAIDRAPRLAPAVRAQLPRVAAAWLVLAQLAIVWVVGRHYLWDAPAGLDVAERTSLAQAFLWTGQAEQAEAQLREILRQRPRHPGAHYYLGLLAERRGEPDTAVRHLRHAMGTREGRELSVAARIVTLLLSGESPPPDARAEALALARGESDAKRGQDPASLRALALALASAGRAEEAVATAEAALARAVGPRDGRLRAAIESELAALRRREPVRPSPAAPASTRELVAYWLGPDHLF
jgi:hypothetical protein